MNGVSSIKYMLPMLLFLPLSALAADAVIADKVLIEKQARRLTLLSKEQEIKTYKITLGSLDRKSVV